MSPKATIAGVVGKIIYVSQHYHFRPHRIAMYMTRYLSGVLIQVRPFYL